MSSFDRLLVRPVQEGARLRALALLDEVVRERARLADVEDAEVVHDFRVALRRLRSLLKAHRAHLGGKVAKLRKRLGDVAALTAEARDAEVQLAWLESRRGGRGAAGRPAFDWLCARLRDHKDRGYTAVRTEAAQAFDALLPRARRRLARFVRDVSADRDEPTLAGALAALLIEHAEGLRAKLGEVASAADVTNAHEARILGKQLRYLLEPLAESTPVGEAARVAVKALKGLQDVLGELHDAHVMAQVVQQAIVDAAAERARQLGEAVFDGRRGRRPRDVRPGLVAIARQVRARRDGLYRELVARRPGVEELVDDVRALAAELARAVPELRMERKYLLRAMPGVAGAEMVDIEEGYLPGGRLEERLRRVRDAGGGVRLTRALELADGVRRTEVEEECPRELFDRLWPLTEGRRIAKIRWRVKDGDLVWNIDRFEGRDLIVAEVELSGEGTQVTPPAWLADAIVRDVTGEPEFADAAIAAASAAAPKRRRRRG
ncbi:MAG TPA: CHAD domain-containing protein [Haliangiales bacterium]|nr:CHAD domain-containing protein [Haliangiales bacterium]